MRLLGFEWLGRRARFAAEGDRADGVLRLADVEGRHRIVTMRAAMVSLPLSKGVPCYATRRDYALTPGRYVGLPDAEDDFDLPSGLPV